MKDSRPNERMAVWSLVCAMVGVVFAPAAVVGIVLGYKARARIIRAEGSTKGEGLALAGIVVGFGAITLLVVVTIVTVLVPHSDQSGDSALAQRELLLANQYPRGFVGQGSGTEVTGASYFAVWAGQDITRVVRCLGINNSHIDSTPVEAGSQEFERGHVRINNTVDVFPTKADAVKDATTSANPHAVRCLFRYWGPTLAQDFGPHLGSGEHDRPPVALGVSGFGDHDSVELWSSRYTYQGRAGTDYTAWVTLQRGKSESNVIISNLDSPVSPKLVQELVNAAERRLEIH